MINKKIFAVVIGVSFFSTNALAMCSKSQFDGVWSSSGGEKVLSISSQCIESEYGPDIMVYDIESYMGTVSNSSVFGNEMMITYPDATQRVTLTSDSSVVIETRENFTK
ncbi:hypothetical protein [Vibrio sp. AND4]|uniref:hypothetical protein n=1 Tax=Vibrio sp. AND4 TaxID=314289 RepID=UPI00015F0F7E|nr:hypothetical protein [Vibrio sp. AND4]EDP57885.1 hypothetical protein AND4_12327 [Vibrio sp. AND4]